MSKKETAVNALLTQKLLPLYYHDSDAVSIEILRSLYNAGIRILEYTNRGEHALSNFMKLRSIVSSEMKDLQLGIGTIKNSEEANDYILAGADFIVSPIISEAVAEATHAAGLLYIPGCMTTTEISLAETCGATLVKLFPGNLLGPSYVSAIKDLFPKIKFMPTGGVEAEEKNLQEWFHSGVVAVGMGSKLITKEYLDKKDYSAITELTKVTLKLIQNVSY